MKTYIVYIKVATPVDGHTFKLTVVAANSGHASDLANKEFPKLEPMMTPDNECSFYISSVEEMTEHMGVVLSCERIR